jgi:uncharacterized MAPEG superfamily protein
MEKIFFGNEIYMELVDLVGALAVLQFLVFGALTGKARAKSGIKAPAIIGDEHFERMYRVQMNTLETLMAFLPALFIATKYWSPIVVACIGFVYLLGRILFWRAYVTEPSKRGLGFMLSIVPTFLLVLMAIIGIVLELI